MRRVLKGGAVVALIAILIVPAVYADDPPDPPSARMRPPIGVEARQATSTVVGLFWVWLQARIGIPPG